MLYLNHDFYSNFSSSISSGDNEFISDMLINELSELIVYKKTDLLKLLKDLEIKVKENSSDEKLVSIILEEISTNTKLVKGLAFMIAQNNVNKKKLKNKPAVVKQIDMIASGITGISDSFNHKTQLKKEFKNKLLQTIKIKLKIVGNVKAKKNKNGDVYILLGLFVLVGIVGATIYFKKKNKKQALTKKAEIIEPDVLDPIVPTPIINEPVVVNPIIPAPVVPEVVEPIVPTPIIQEPNLIT